MTLHILIQKKLSEFIEVVTIADKTLIGSRLHEHVHFVLKLPEVKKTLEKRGVKFREIIVRPRSHPSHTSDVELILENGSTWHASVKVAVGADVRRALDELAGECLARGWHGILIFAIVAVRGERSELRVVFVLIENDAFRGWSVDAILMMLLELLEQKVRREGFERFSIIEMHGLAAQEALVKVIELEKAVRDLREIVDKLRSDLRREIVRESEKIRKELSEKVESLKELILKLLSQKKQ